MFINVSINMQAVMIQGVPMLKKKKKKKINNNPFL